MAVKRVAKTEKTENNFNVKITRAHDFGDKGIAVDMEVNGVKIYSCWYKTYEDRKKPGEETSFMSFPSRKGSDGKWYQYVWFPISDELLSDIEDQISKLLEENK